MITEWARKTFRHGRLTCTLQIDEDEIGNDSIIWVTIKDETSVIQNEMFFGSFPTGVEASQFLQDFASKMLKAAKALKKE